MMMNDNKKKAASIIVSASEPQDEAMVGYEAAAEDILLAIKEQSPKRLKEALKAFVDMCKYEQESDDEMED